jgi:hypothetical protein
VSVDRSRSYTSSLCETHNCTCDFYSLSEILSATDKSALTGTVSILSVPVPMTPARSGKSVS